MASKQTRGRECAPPPLRGPISVPGLPAPYSYQALSRQSTATAPARYAMTDTAAVSFSDCLMQDLSAGAGPPQKGASFPPTGGWGGKHSPPQTEEKSFPRFEGAGGGGKTQNVFFFGTGGGGGIRGGGGEVV